jgi:hypothetical protein
VSKRVEANLAPLQLAQLGLGLADSLGDLDLREAGGPLFIPEGAAVGPARA